MESPREKKNYVTLSFSATAKRELQRRSGGYTTK
jgi:hypothetical protein